MLGSCRRTDVGADAVAVVVADGCGRWVRRYMRCRRSTSLAQLSPSSAGVANLVGAGGGPLSFAIHIVPTHVAVVVADAAAGGAAFRRQVQLLSITSLQWCCRPSPSASQLVCDVGAVVVAVHVGAQRRRRCRRRRSGAGGGGSPAQPQLASIWLPAESGKLSPSPWASPTVCDIGVAVTAVHYRRRRRQSLSPIPVQGMPWLLQLSSSWSLRAVLPPSLQAVADVLCTGQSIRGDGMWYSTYNSSALAERHRKIRRS